VVVDLVDMDPVLVVLVAVALATMDNQMVVMLLTMAAVAEALVTIPTLEQRKAAMATKVL
jgi:hypothetical protein